MVFLCKMLYIEIFLVKLEKQFIFIIFPNEIDEISNEINRCPVLYESGRVDGHFFKSLSHPTIHQGIDKKEKSFSEVVFHVFHYIRFYNNQDLNFWV